MDSTSGRIHSPEESKHHQGLLHAVLLVRGHHADACFGGSNLKPRTLPQFRYVVPEEQVALDGLATLDLKPEAVNPTP